jgi:hypothetical protein
MIYAALFLMSYLFAGVHVRNMIAKEKNQMRVRLTKKCSDADLVEGVLGDADKWIYTIGPAFFYGSLLGALLSFVAWFLLNLRHG